MLTVDFHVHTFFSHCGIHTHLEMLKRGKELGMDAVAITDHGPELEARSTGPFWDRLNVPVEGIRLLKGMECNLSNDRGDIDLQKKYLPYMDIVLLGLHPNTEKGLGEAVYTDMLIAAIEKNPTIDIITHPNDASYPVEFQRLALAAKRNGIALELNNSKTLLQRIGDEVTSQLIRVCKDVECRMAICSDAHAIEELGRDDSVRPLLEQEKFPSELIINDTTQKAYAFLERRRMRKKI